ncbi:S9 family peptidase [Luteococcus sediminum]
MQEHRTTTGQQDETVGTGSPWQDLQRYVRTQRIVGVKVAPAARFLVLALQETNKDDTAHVTSLWRLPADGSTAPVRLTRSSEGEGSFAIAQDGSLVFTSGRPAPEGSGEKEDQSLWLLPDGPGEARLMGRRPGGWDALLAARGSSRLVTGLGLLRGCTTPEQDDAKRRERRRHKVQAILHDGAGVRFWDHDLDSPATVFTALDLSQEQPEPSEAVGLDLGRGLGPEAALSHDGSFLVTTQTVAAPHGTRRERLVRIDLDEGDCTVLLDEPGHHFSAPVLSPDDRLVTCVRSVDGDDRTAVRQVLHLVDLSSGEHHDLAADWPRWGSPAGFSPDGGTLYVTADEDGAAPVFAIDIVSQQVRRLTGAGAHQQVQVCGDALFALRQAWDEPGSVVRIDAASGRSTVLWSLDGPVLPGRLERVEATASDGVRIPGWLVLPEGADAEHPAPLVLWAHGGPLNSWNAWSWRWCPWLLAAHGLAVLLPDPALSTGYGRDFIQRGWGDWNCAYTDLMAATDAVVQRPDIDSDRTAMMGGSFGGWMANWVAGHTDRFRCIVSHASLWNLDSFVASTDVPWFWGLEMSERMRAENSPHHFVDRISTPMLVVHGDKDYRVPVGEGLSLWWALNRAHGGSPEQMPHRFLYFPDENHWVLKPQHAIVWYQMVLCFLGQHLGLDGIEQAPDWV